MRRREREPRGEVGCGKRPLHAALAALSVVLGCEAASVGSASTATSSALPADAAGLRAAEAPRTALDASSSQQPTGSLTIALRPRLQPRAGVSVVVELTGDAVAPVGEFAMAPQWGGIDGSAHIRELVVDDAQGTVAHCTKLHQGRCTMDRGARGGRVRASYFAEASEKVGRLGLHVGPEGLSAVGHTFLLLPDTDGLVNVRLRWDLTDLGTAANAASSYGVGTDVVAKSRPSDVAHSLYLAGKLVVREGGFNERLIALRETSFDVAEALSFFSEALDAGRRSFDPSDRVPFTFVLLPWAHLSADHDGVHLYQSIGLWFDQDRRFDARLRVLATHEIVHRWIGGKLRLLNADGSEALWFTEGFTTHFARVLLHRRGLLSHREFVNELNRSVQIEQRAYDPRPEPEPGLPFLEPEPIDASAPKHDRGGPDEPVHDPLVVHHGALYAALLESELERQSDGSLVGLIRSLLERARASNGTLPVAALREAVEKAAGSAAGDELERLMVGGEGPIDPPSGAFGPCIVRLLSKEARYELGFDAASITNDPPIVRGLVPRSAAERAGLREGDVLISGHRQIRLGDAAQSISLVVKGDRGMRIVRYSPNAAPYRVRWEVSSRCR